MSNADQSRKHTSPQYNISSLETSIPRGTAERCEFQKKVSFGQLQLREYSKTILDHANPGVTSGVGITMGGDFTEYDPISIESFESRRVPRKRGDDLKLSDNERIKRLIASGYQVKEIRTEMYYTRKFQAKNAKALKREEAMDALVSKFKKVVFSRKMDKDELDSPVRWSAAA